MDRRGSVDSSNSLDESTSSTGSNDDDDNANVDADDSSFRELSNQLPLTTAEGQAFRHPSYTLSMATLAAKREYNRQNAARARKRAKTLLHTYQEQIQVLTTQLAQLRDQNRTLLTSLQLLREENISIHQAQQALEAMDRGRTATTADAGNAQTPVLDMNTGVSTQQTSLRQQSLPSSFTQQEASNQQYNQWTSNQSILPMVVQPTQQQRMQPLPPILNNNFNLQRQIQQYLTPNVEPMSYISRTLPQSMVAASNNNPFPICDESAALSYDTSTNSSDTGSNEQNAKVECENSNNHHNINFNDSNNNNHQQP